MERLLRKIRRSAALRRAASALIAAYIRLVYRTTRWEFRNPEVRARYRHGGRVILALWHGRLFPILAERPPGRRVVAIVSANRDGDIVTGVVERFGAEALRGSTRNPKKADKDKRSWEAGLEAVHVLRHDPEVLVALTPDGPRGPRMRCNDGAAALSILSRTPVVPYSYSCRWGRNLSTWDRFLVPFPFGRGVMVFGDPIEPPDRRAPDAIESHRAAIERALLAATEEADRAVGRAPVAPAPDPRAEAEPAA